MKGKEVLDEVFFEVRFYVEYWDWFKELVEKLWEEVIDEKNFIEFFNGEMERVKELFKIDFKIFF